MSDFKCLQIYLSPEENQRFEEWRTQQGLRRSEAGKKIILSFLFGEEKSTPGNKASASSDRVEKRIGELEENQKIIFGAYDAILARLESLEEKNSQFAKEALEKSPEEDLGNNEFPITEELEPESLEAEEPIAEVTINFIYEKQKVIQAIGYKLSSCYVAVNYQSKNTKYWGGEKLKYGCEKIEYSSLYRSLKSAKNAVRKANAKDEKGYKPILAISLLEIVEPSKIPILLKTWKLLEECDEELKLEAKATNYAL